MQPEVSVLKKITFLIFLLILFACAVKLDQNGEKTHQED